MESWEGNDIQKWGMRQWHKTNKVQLFKTRFAYLSRGSAHGDKSTLECSVPRLSIFRMGLSHHLTSHLRTTTVFSKLLPNHEATGTYPVYWQSNMEEENKSTMVMRWGGWRSPMAPSLSNICKPEPTPWYMDVVVCGFMTKRMHWSVERFQSNNWFLRPIGKIISKKAPRRKHTRPTNRQDLRKFGLFEQISQCQ